MQTKFVIRLRTNPYNQDRYSKEEIREALIQDWNADPILTLEGWVENLGINVDVEFDECPNCDDRGWIFIIDKEGDKCISPCPECQED